MDFISLYMNAGVRMGQKRCLRPARLLLDRECEGRFSAFQTPKDLCPTVHRSTDDPCSALEKRAPCGKQKLRSRIRKVLSDARSQGGLAMVHRYRGKPRQGPARIQLLSLDQGGAANPFPWQPFLFPLSLPAVWPPLSLPALRSQ